MARCLQCGKQMALLKKLTGASEFCSDNCRHSYQEEFNRLALDRLMATKPRAAANAASLLTATPPPPTPLAVAPEPAIPVPEQPADFKLELPFIQVLDWRPLSPVEPAWRNRRTLLPSNGVALDSVFPETEKESPPPPMAGFEPLPAVGIAGPASAPERRIRQDGPMASTDAFAPEFLPAKLSGVLGMGLRRSAEVPSREMSALWLPVAARPAASAQALACESSPAVARSLGRTESASPARLTLPRRSAVALELCFEAANRAGTPETIEGTPVAFSHVLSFSEEPRNAFTTTGLEPLPPANEWEAFEASIAKQHVDHDFLEDLLREDEGGKVVSDRVKEAKPLATEPGLAVGVEPATKGVETVSPLEPAGPSLLPRLSSALLSDVPLVVEVPAVVEPAVVEPVVAEPVAADPPVAGRVSLADPSAIAATPSKPISTNPDARPFLWQAAQAVSRPLELRILGSVAASATVAAEPVEAAAVARPEVARPPEAAPRAIVEAPPPAEPEIKAAEPEAAQVPAPELQAKSEPPAEPEVKPVAEAPAPEPSAPGHAAALPNPVQFETPALPRGRMAQGFPPISAAAFRIHAPVLNSLPLRPALVIGLKPAAPAAAIPVPDPVATPAKAEPAATGRSETRPAESKLAETVPAETTPVQPADAGKEDLSKDSGKGPVKAKRAKPTPVPAPAPAPAPTAEPAREVRETPARERVIRPMSPRPGSIAARDRSNAVPAEVEEPVRQPAPAAPAPKPKLVPIREEAAPVQPETQPTPGPSLSLSETDSSFLSKIPLWVKIAVAAVLVVGIGFVLFSGRSDKGGVSGVPGGETALVGGGGWISNWGSDGKGNDVRTISIYRPSTSLSDYRIEFAAMIEQKGIGWVFRASDPKNYYVMKLEVLKPGLERQIGLVKYAVINGEVTNMVRTKLPGTYRADTTYRVITLARGSKFTTYVQDQVIDVTTDDQLRLGGVGLLSEQGQSATLRSIQISALK